MSNSIHKFTRVVDTSISPTKLLDGLEDASIAVTKVIRGTATPLTLNASYAVQDGMSGDLRIPAHSVITHVILTSSPALTAGASAAIQVALGVTSGTTTSTFGDPAAFASINGRALVQTVGGIFAGTNNTFVTLKVTGADVTAGTVNVEIHYV